MIGENAHIFMWRWSTVQKPIRQGVASKFLKLEDAGRHQIDDKVSAPFNVLETRKTLFWDHLDMIVWTCEPRILNVSFMMYAPSFLVGSLCNKDIEFCGWNDKGWSKFWCSRLFLWLYTHFYPFSWLLYCGESLLNTDWLWNSYWCKLMEGCISVCKGGGTALLHSLCLFYIHVWCFLLG